MNRKVSDLLILVLNLIFFLHHLSVLPKIRSYRSLPLIRLRWFTMILCFFTRVMMKMMPPVSRCLTGCFIHQLIWLTGEIMVLWHHWKISNGPATMAPGLLNVFIVMESFISTVPCSQRNRCTCFRQSVWSLY